MSETKDFNGMPILGNCTRVHAKTRGLVIGWRHLRRSYINVVFVTDRLHD